jgi:ABC-2 type transport system ATP-binding protein
MIKTSNLTKRFGSKIAVNNLSLEVKKGEIFGFLGPNAAGKTTTIKLLAGLLRPTEGSVFILGYDIQKDSLKAKSILSYIPDVPFIFEGIYIGIFGFKKGSVDFNDDSFFSRT